MTIYDVYGARREAEVMNDTWGHLRPQVGRHNGYIIAARSIYDSGARMLIDSEFGDIPGSPWMYEAMLDLVDDAPLKEGGVYEFSGACVVEKAGLRFEGEWHRVDTTKGEKQ